MEKPSFVSLQIINTCNLNCEQCDYHFECCDPNILSVEQQCEIVRMISDWSPEIRLKITGGEPFLDKDRLFAVLEEAYRQKLVSFILTNGTLINSKDILKLFELNLGCISVSLDSHIPEVHDSMRGKKGCWEKVSSLVKEFTNLRKTNDANTRIWASTILTKNNLRLIEDLVLEYESMGFDAIKFQPLFPYFRRKYDENWKKDSTLYPSEEEILKGIDDILRLKKTHPIVDQSLEHITKIKSYLLNSNTDEIECDVMSHVMIVGCDGCVRYCFQQDPKVKFCEITPCHELNVKNVDLKTIWELNTTLRKQMKLHCHRPCGLLWNSVRDIKR